MTNDLKTPSNLARVAAKVVSDATGLARHFHRDVEADFAKGTGKVVSISVPGTVATSSRPVGSTENYEISNLTEKSVDVVLSAETPTPP